MSALSKALVSLLFFVVGFVAGAGVLLLLHSEHWLGLGGTRQVEAFSQVPDELAGTLAARFRPWLEFDSHEPWRPLNVEYLFDEGTQRFCTREARRSSCVPIRDAAGFNALTASTHAGAATYVDIAGDRSSAYHGPARCRPLLDCNAGKEAAIYYHVTESNDRFYIDFWWFLRFNHFSRSLPGLSCRSELARTQGVCDEHEGDWEGVTVVTRPDDQKHIDYVVYAAHKGTFRYTASQLTLQSGTRPVVYLAEGSHAAYPAKCVGSCHQPPELAAQGLVDLPEGEYDGKGGWGRNADSCAPNKSGSCLQSLTSQAWTFWAGQWGAGCPSACGGAIDPNSPRSPGVQARYETPWCSSQNGVFTCDGRSLHCSDWLGPLVVAVACDPVLLTNGLRSSNKTPPGRLALIIGASSISHATTPGVVQALGHPLKTGSKLAVVADGGATEILVRAAQHAVVAEDRFANLGAVPGQRIVVTVSAGTDGPTVLAGGRRPIERRILEQPSG
jgi:Vacuolar protein sorting-associated protein 62